MVLLVIAAVTAALFWAGSKEKPEYRKTYFRTRSDGVFKTECAPGFDEYIERVKEEVDGRVTVGPLAPTDDLYAELYHPEAEENWRRKLSGHKFQNWLRDALNLIFGSTICAAVAGMVVEVFAHPSVVASNLLSEPGDPNMMLKLVARAFAIAVCGYVYRSRTSINRTQGYLDGYSDHCVGPERALRFTRPPSPRA